MVTISQNILEHILCIQDIFYYFSQFICYEDWISISMLDKSFSKRFRSLLKIQMIYNIFYKKFLQKTPKLYYRLYPFNYNNLLNDKNFVKLESYDFRKLYLEENLHTGDIVYNDSEHFILDKDVICSTNYSKYEDCLPKYIQKKYGLSRWKICCQMSAYVRIRMKDFDFTKIEFYFRERLIYVKVWNDRLKIYVWTYIWYLQKDIDINHIKENTEKKIESIIYNQKLSRSYSIQDEYDNYFYEKGDMKIYLYTIFPIYDSCNEWFLE